MYPNTKCGYLISRCPKLEKIKLIPLDNIYCTEKSIYLFNRKSLTWNFNCFSWWLHYSLVEFLMKSYLFLRTTCSIQQLRHILSFCSELLEVAYSQDDTVCLCCWKLYRHFQCPISKDEKVIFLFCINKGSRIWFSTLSIGSHLHMRQEQNFSKSK